MFRMAKLTDYGIVLLTQFAVRQDATPMTAREIAGATKLPASDRRKASQAALAQRTAVLSPRHEGGLLSSPGRRGRSPSPRSSRCSKGRWPSPNARPRASATRSASAP